MQNHRFLIKVEASRLEELEKACASAGVSFDPLRDVFVLAQDNWEIEVFTTGDLDELAELTNEHLEEDAPDEPRRLKLATHNLSLEEKERLLHFYQTEVSFRHSLRTSVSGIPRESLDELQKKAPGVFQEAH